MPSPDLCVPCIYMLDLDLDDVSRVLSENRSWPVSSSLTAAARQLLLHCPTTVHPWTYAKPVLLYLYFHGQTKCSRIYCRNNPCPGGCSSVIGTQIHTQKSVKRNKPWLQPSYQEEGETLSVSFLIAGYILLEKQLPSWWVKSRFDHMNISTSLL